MAPDGEIFFAGSQYHNDFSNHAVRINDRATFVHEGRIFTNATCWGGT